MHACLRTLKSAGISGKATEQSLRGGSELAELLPDDDKDLFVNGESAERGMYKRPCSRARKRDTLSGNGAETLQHAYIHTYIHTYFHFHFPRCRSPASANDAEGQVIRPGRLLCLLHTPLRELCVLGTTQLSHIWHRKRGRNQYGTH